MKSRMKIAQLCAILLLFVSVSIAQTPEKNDALKQVLIDKNPTNYQEMGGQTDVPEFTTKAEKIAYFNSMFPNQILPNGDIVTPKKPQTRTTVILPNEPSFPVYVSTGNKELDDQNYLQQKLDWVNNHPRKYSEMEVPESTPVPQSIRLQSDLKPQK